MPGGRPKKTYFDYQAVETMCSIQCTQKEIAEYFECSVKTLQRDKEFCRIYKKNRAKGSVSLRRLQWKSCKEGNITMQIWLGKQYLGQTDKAELDARIYQPKKLSDMYVDKKAKSKARTKS